MKSCDSDASRADTVIRRRFRRGEPPLLLGSQLWEEDHVTDRRLVGKEHDQPVDADTFARSRWHAVLQGAQEVFIDQMGFFVSRRPLRGLLFEPFPLIQWVVQL